MIFFIHVIYPKKKKKKIQACDKLTKLLKILKKKKKKKWNSLSYLDSSKKRDAPLRKYFCLTSYPNPSFLTFCDLSIPIIATVPANTYHIKKKKKKKKGFRAFATRHQSIYVERKLGYTLTLCMKRKKQTPHMIRTILILSFRN